MDCHPSSGQIKNHASSCSTGRCLEKHSPVLAKKPELIIANKMDLTDSEPQLLELQNALNCEIIPISAVTGAGLDRFHGNIWEMIEVGRASESETSS